MKLTSNQILLTSASVFLAAGLAACSTAYPPRDTSARDSISAQMKQSAAVREKDKAPVSPEAVSASLLPPVKPAVPRLSDKQLQQRFDLVVTDAPISQVLMGIVEGTRYSILVKPKNPLASAPVVPGAAQTAATGAASVAGLSDRVTVTLKDVTLFEALDSIREVYGYDYTVEGNRIYVQQPELQTRLYKVNYIIGQRRGVSDIQVVGGASVGSTGLTSTQTGVAPFSSVQASAMSTIAKSDLWADIEDALRTTLGCLIPKTRTTVVQPTTQTTGTASRADVAFNGDFPMDVRQRGVDGCTDGRSISISQMGGTVMVRGMPFEHRMVERILRDMQVQIERQVIIEAKVVDVQLNSDSQQGINWAIFNNNLHRFSMGATTTSLDGVTPGGANTTYGGAVAAGTTLGGLLGTAMVGTTGTAFTAGMGFAMQARNFQALINFLETQGQVHVLSSPRIATLNNQKAVIKVGSEEPYITNIDGGTTSVSNNTTTTIQPTLRYQPFFSGISLDVTPQIDDRENITLHVHAMVNSVTQKNKVSQIAVNPVTVPFAVNTVSETDSVVRARDGQVVVIGGLMTQGTSDNRSEIPGIGEAPIVGPLFRKGGQQTTKRELVILLKTTVVKDESWSSDISASQERVEKMMPPEPKPVPRSGSK